MYIKIPKQHKKALLTKQINAAKTVDDLKSIMLEMIKTPPMLNNSPQRKQDGRV